MDLRGNWNYPTTVRFGAGRIGELGEHVKAAGMRNPLLVTDPTVAKMPMTAKAMETLSAAGIAATLFSDVQPNPVEANLAAGIAAFNAGGHDGVVAFGGGSALDAGKLIAFMKGQTRPVFDFEDVGDWWTRADASVIAPIVAVPTTAGTGSEVGRAAVVTNEKTHTKKIIFHPAMLPKVTICDPELTVGMPPIITAGTGMDALAHAVECFTMSYHQPFTDAVALLAMEYVAKYLRVAFSQAGNLEARYHMSAAAMLAGLAYGTDSAGAAHAMSQTAGGVHDAPHGALTARLLGPVMEYNYAGEPERFARMAAAFGIDVRGMSTFGAAEMAVEYVYQLTDDVEIPGLQELGFKEEEIPMLADKAFADPQTIGNPRDVDAAAYRKIYQRAFDLGATEQ